MNNLLKRLAERWAQLSMAKKSIVVVMGMSFILASYFFYSWMTKTEYAPLFTNMQVESAGKITEKLKEMNIEYRLSDEGKTILVPDKEVYNLRLKLASDGVFTGEGVGFELFDNSPLGTTDFERQLNYQRALQEELRRTITQLKAVEQARVHLVIPEESVFIDEKGQSSASIFLKLKPTESLESSQVKGIVELVASSVENLEPKDVTVIDTDGRVLSDFIADEYNLGYTAVQIKQQELKKHFERDLERRIQTLLERMYGNGKVVAMVTADLDFDQREVTSVDWGDKVERSQQTITNEDQTMYDTPDPVGDGNRLTDSEMLNTYSSIDNAGNSSSNSDQAITNYEIDKIEEKVVYAPGRVRNLSAAVTIDDLLPQEKVDDIKEIISAAIGYRADRGDNITVLSMKFDKSQLDANKKEMEKLAAEQQKKDNMSLIMSWVFKGLGILLAFILGLMFIRTLRTLLKEPERPIEEPTPVQEVEKELQDTEQKIIKDKLVLQEQKAQKIVKEKPKEAVQVINTWLSED